MSQFVLTGTGGAEQSGRNSQSHIDPVDVDAPRNTGLNFSRLNVDVIEAIFSLCDPRTRHSFSNTCGEFFAWRYETIHLALGAGDAAATKVIERPVRSLVLSDSTSLRRAPATPSDQYPDILRKLDNAIGKMLAHSQNGLRTFVLDATSTGLAPSPSFPSVFDKLKDMPELHTLALIGVGTMPDAPLALFPDSLVPLRRAVVRNVGPLTTWGGALLVLDGQRGLDLKDHEVHQAGWENVLCPVALSWTALQQLVLDCTEENILDYVGLVKHCVAVEALFGAPVLRFRLVVAKDGEFMFENLSKLVVEILERLSRLEELVLDSITTIEYTPLLGSQYEWNEALRRQRKPFPFPLKRLVLPTLFASNPSDPSQVRDLKNPLSNESDEMLPALSSSLLRIYKELTVSAETLALRMYHPTLPALAEIRFLHDHANGHRETLGFDLVAMDNPQPMNGKINAYTRSARGMGLAEDDRVATRYIIQTQDSAHM
ncbi:hypothetical protein B0H21DRAFT_823404 [Amylocystis lapponica]|nr:hypothetical protein B0H21DRAFT_823404 [Amylocystis lapponica]